MDNSAWFFGCSFTFGSGCRLRPSMNPEEDDNSLYYRKYPEKRGKLWTTHVSEFLSVEEHNLGEGGCSNDFIIRKIIETLPKFKKGDYIFLGMTNTNRMELFLPDRNRSPRQLLFPLTSFDTPVLSEEEIEVSNNFVYFFRDKPSLRLRAYYKDTFMNFKTYFDLLGIKTMVWGPELWGNFDTIARDTNYEISDNHWSWLGHTQFTEFIKDNHLKTESGFIQTYKPLITKD